MAQQIPASTGRPYGVYTINEHQVAVTRNGYTIPFSKADLANVFEALLLLIERSF